MFAALASPFKTLTNSADKAKRQNLEEAKQDKTSSFMISTRRSDNEDGDLFTEDIPVYGRVPMSKCSQIISSVLHP